MPSQLRLQRIADRIREELSEMVSKGDERSPRCDGIIDHRCESRPRI